LVGHEAKSFHPAADGRRAASRRHGQEQLGASEDGLELDVPVEDDADEPGV